MYFTTVTINIISDFLTRQSVNLKLNKTHVFSALVSLMKYDTLIRKKKLWADTTNSRSDKSTYRFRVKKNCFYQYQFIRQVNISVKQAIKIILHVNLSMIDVELPDLFVDLSDHFIYVDRSKHLMMTRKRMFL